MVVEGSPLRRRGALGAAVAVVSVAVLPLIAPEVWDGFRVALADPVLSGMSSYEQPLSVRSPGGAWAMGLALVWFGLAYWHRNFALWEAALVLVGGAAALARVGNLWLDAAALVLPLARQVACLQLRWAVLLAVGAVCLAVAGRTLVQTRPPELPGGAVEAVRQATSPGKVMTEWRWASELQRRLGGDRLVLASAGVASEPTEFWLDYLRIAQGHERWAELLRNWDVGTLVLESEGQQHPAAELVRGSTEWRITYDVDGTLVAERVNP